MLAIAVSIAVQAGALPTFIDSSAALVTFIHEIDFGSLKMSIFPAHFANDWNAPRLFQTFVWPLSGKGSDSE